MKFRYIIFLLLLTSCYTKNGALKRFCKSDTITTQVLIHDTIVVDRLTTDTIFSTLVDSVVVVKDKLVIKYQKKGGKVHLSGEYKGDTIYKERIIEVKTPCNCPEPIKHWYSPFINWLAIIGILAVLFTVFKIFK